MLELSQACIFFGQVSGKALKDSVRIVTKFSEMEDTYMSLGSLRFDTCLSCVHRSTASNSQVQVCLLSVDAMCCILIAALTYDPDMMLSLMWHLKSSGFLKMDIKA